MKTASVVHSVTGGAAALLGFCIVIFSLLCLFIDPVVPYEFLIFGLVGAYISHWGISSFRQGMKERSDNAAKRQEILKDL